MRAEHLSLHDYGEEDEPDFSMAQKKALHEAIIGTDSELLTRLGGKPAEGWNGAKGDGPWAVSISTGNVDGRCEIEASWSNP